MSDSDLIKLYSGRILALAADMPRTDPVEPADAVIKKRSPLCGSSVRVSLSVEDGRVAAYGQEVKACALGQAAASVVGRHIVGCTRDQVTQARDQLAGMLNVGGPAPDAPFDDLEVLRPAADFKNRHASILLTLDAALEALDVAADPACV